MDSKNVLIVCWDFPPNNAIGGRRWAKMAGSFLRLGYEVSVISKTCDLKSKKNVWISKQELETVNAYSLNEHFLVTWLNDYASPLKFFKIRIAKFLLSFLFKGTVFDKTIARETKFIDLAKKIIEERKVRTVFVTGAPFNLLYYSAKLKAIFPNIKIIADYRDPWIHAQNYGMKNLSACKKREELKKQNFVFENVDYVTAPNSFLLSEIKNSYTGTKVDLAQFIELSHAYDPADVQAYKTSQIESRTKIRLIYAGSLYMGLEKHLAFLNASITYHKNTCKNPLFEIDFYTNELSHESIFAENTDTIKFSKPIGDTIFKEIQNSDFIFILLADHNKNYVTSKFYEFLPYNKPYVYVGPDGFVSNKIVTEKFGYMLRREEDLSRLIRNVNDSITLPEKVIEKYTFDDVVRSFLSKLNNE